MIARLVPAKLRWTRTGAVSITAVAACARPAIAQASAPGAPWTLYRDQVKIPEVRQFGEMKLAAGSDESYAFIGSEGIGVFVGGGPVVSDVPKDLDRLIDVAMGGDHVVALEVTGRVRCWGANSYGEATVPNGLGKVTAIAAGDIHSIALLQDGKVRCWGAGTFEFTYAKNGYGSSYPHVEQSRVPADLAGVVAIAANCLRSAALCRDGRLVTWGGRNSGKLQQPADLPAARAMAIGGAHAVVLASNGDVHCFGRFLKGDVRCSVPSEFGSVTAVAASKDMTAAMTDSGKVLTWTISPGGLSKGNEVKLPATVGPATWIRGSTSHFPTGGFVAISSPVASNSSGTVTVERPAYVPADFFQTQGVDAGELARAQLKMAVQPGKPPLYSVSDFVRRRNIPQERLDVLWKVWERKRRAESGHATPR